MRSASLEKLQDVLVAWYCIPIERREPRTQLELAKMLGIHLQTLLRLKRSPDFRNSVANNVRADFACRLPEMIEKLVSRALEGNLRAMELFYGVAGIR